MSCRYRIQSRLNSAYLSALSTVLVGIMEISKMAQTGVEIACRVMLDSIPPTPGSSATPVTKTNVTTVSGMDDMDKVWRAWVADSIWHQWGNM